MNVAVCTLYDGKAQELADLTIPNQQEWAKNCGYTYESYFGKIDNSRPVAWSKLLLIARLLPRFSHVIWLDIDVIVRSIVYEFESEEFRPKLRFVHQPRDNSPNSGILFVPNRKCSFETLGRLYLNYPMAWDCPWWEQEALIRDYENFPDAYDPLENFMCDFEGDKREPNAIFLSCVWAV